MKWLSTLAAALIAGSLTLGAAAPLSPAAAPNSNPAATHKPKFSAAGPVKATLVRSTSATPPTLNVKAELVVNDAGRGKGWRFEFTPKFATPTAYKCAKPEIYADRIEAAITWAQGEDVEEAVYKFSYAGEAPPPPPNVAAVAWECRDTAGKLLAGATFLLTPGPSGSGSATIVDNGAGDSNSAAGQVQVSSVALGSYAVAQIAAPSGYSVDTAATRAVSVTKAELTAIGTMGTDDAAGTATADFHCAGTTPPPPPPPPPNSKFQVMFLFNSHEMDTMTAGQREMCASLTFRDELAKRGHSFAGSFDTNEVGPNGVPAAIKPWFDAVGTSGLPRFAAKPLSGGEIKSYELPKTVAEFWAAIEKGGK